MLWFRVVGCSAISVTIYPSVSGSKTVTKILILPGMFYFSRRIIAQFSSRWIVYGQSLGPHVIFETFRYLVEDWEELGPPTETSRWNLSHGMGFDGRKDHPRPQNPRKSLKIVFSKIWVDSWMNFLWFWDNNQCIRLLPMRSTQWTSQNLWISI